MNRPDKAGYFDRHVSVFDRMQFTEEEARKLEWFRARWRIEPGMTVLEPGCGAGRLTRHLADWVGPQGEVVVADISPQMMAAHRRNVPARNIRRYCTPILELNLPAESVDVVVCFHAFPHFDDKLETLSFFARMLRPDGRVCVAHSAGRDKINQIHANAGGAVAADTIPLAPDMEALFHEAGLLVEELVDREDRYYVQARRAASASAIG